MASKTGYTNEDTCGIAIYCEWNEELCTLRLTIPDGSESKHMDFAKNLVKKYTGKWSNLEATRVFLRQDGLVVKWEEGEG